MRVLGRRLVFYLITALAAISVDFFIPRMMPGNPVEAILARLQGQIITHDIASARYLADSIMVMYAGQQVEFGPATTVTDAPAHPHTRLLLNAAPDPDRAAPPVLAGRGVPPSLVNPPAGCRFHPRCPHAMAVCAERAAADFEVSAGHRSACWLYATGLTGGQSRPLAEARGETRAPARSA